MNGATITLNASLITLNGNTVNTGTLEVRADTDLQTNLHVGADATIDGNLTVGGNLSVAGELSSPTIAEMKDQIALAAATISSMSAAIAALQNPTP